MCVENDCKILKLYVVPSVAQTMILGVDFCKMFRLSVVIVLS